MSRTIIDVLVDIGYAVELSSLKDTRGIFISNKSIALNGKLFEGTGIDVSGSVFYKCSLATDCIEGACLIYCSTNVGVSVPKDLVSLCTSSKVSLIDVDFLKADIHGVNLRHANLQGTNLQGANLRYACLNQADLRGANLQGVELQNANIDRCIFSSDQKTIIKSFIVSGRPLFIGPVESLEGADLRYTYLQGANLQGANLQEANLVHANLQDANLQGADLYGVNLKDANLQGADLRGARIISANLENANLKNANLSGAYLVDVALQHANLIGANLNAAFQSGLELYYATYSNRTIGLDDEYYSVMEYCEDDLDELED